MKEKESIERKKKISNCMIIILAILFPICFLMNALAIGINIDSMTIAFFLPLFCLVESVAIYHIYKEVIKEHFNRG